MLEQSLAARLRHSLRFDGLWWRRFAYLGSVYGPEWWKRYSPPLIGAIFFLTVGRNRRAAVVNLQRILDDPARRRAPWVALRMFSEFAHCMAETLEYYSPRPLPIQLDVPTDDALAAVLREGRGAVVVTGHVGNWDIAAKTLRDYGRPINIVMAREVNFTAHDFMRQARERAGVRVIYADSSVFSSLNMIRALRNNEIVALQLDRSAGAGGTRLVPFFGAPARFPSGPFALARLSGAPLVPIFIPRVGTRHYSVRIYGPFRVPREGRDARAVAATMREVIATFENILHEFPSQWFQFTPFWTPEASASVANEAKQIEAPLGRSGTAG
ncbi:MAG TPA: lysophospholipid acyltransferase family protein [Candidatus Acidoferrales bacterium]|nr:lysophospholipid acyltransferase family protein [Candidatus Acidoferrales bacterium]